MSFYTWSDTPIPFSDSMATTQRNTDFLPLVHASHITPAPSFWKRIKSGVADFWFTNPVVNLMCCTSPVTQQEVTLKRRQHTAVREALMTSLAYHDRECVIEAVMADVRADGYELQRDGPRDREATTAILPYVWTFEAQEPVEDEDPDVRGAPAIQGAAQEQGEQPPPNQVLMPEDERVEEVGEQQIVVFAPRPELPHAAPMPPPPPPPPVIGGDEERRDLRGVFFVPRFAASVVVAVRARVGQLPAGVPGNVLIVEREALRLMRKYNVREVDSVAHLPSIISNYFSADVHYRVETSTSRMTRFQRWLMGESQPPTAFAPLA